MAGPQIACSLLLVMMLLQAMVQMVLVVDHLRAPLQEPGQALVTPLQLALEILPQQVCRWMVLLKQDSLRLVSQMYPEVDPIQFLSASCNLVHSQVAQSTAAVHSQVAHSQLTLAQRAPSSRALQAVLMPSDSPLPRL